MSADRNPFLPVRGRILRENADLVCDTGFIASVEKGMQEIEQALDKLTDPELQLAARDYGAMLRATPGPLTPEPLA